MGARTVVKLVVALIVALSLLSASLTGYTYLNSREQSRRIQRVEIRVDQATTSQVAAQKQQLTATQAQVNRLSVVADRNRRLILILLQLRKNNPQLFQGISIPGALLQEIRRPMIMPVAHKTVSVVPAKSHSRPRVPAPQVTAPTPHSRAPAPSPVLPAPAPMPSPPFVVPAPPAAPARPPIDIPTPLPPTCALGLVCTH